MTGKQTATAADLTELKTLLARVGELAQLLADPLLDRLLQAFTRLPTSDREAILSVLERDATWCRIVEQTADTTGISVRANPHASLYVHVIDQQTEPLRRDVDVIRFGIEQFINMLPLFFEPGVHAQWTVAARELIREADPELRGYGARLAHEILRLLDEGPAAGATDETTSPSPPA